MDCGLKEHLNIIELMIKEYMNKKLINILACPLCKGDLDLSTEEEDGENIIRGTLRCMGCNENYPIQDSLPNLIPPKLRYHSE